MEVAEEGHMGSFLRGNRRRRAYRGVGRYLETSRAVEGAGISSSVGQHASEDVWGVVGLLISRVIEGLIQIPKFDCVGGWHLCVSGNASGGR